MDCYIDTVENAKMRAFIEDLDMVTPLEPRDLFYGRRTKAYTLFKETTAVEVLTIMTSLDCTTGSTRRAKYYWAIQKSSQTTSQVCMTTRVSSNAKSSHQEIFLFPALPCKTNGKLLFHLCKSCADRKHQMPCAHIDEERAFVGTWVTDEVKKAVEMGYKIAKQYEIWHIRYISQYDPDTMRGAYSQNMWTRFWNWNKKLAGGRPGVNPRNTNWNTSNFTIRRREYDSTIIEYRKMPVSGPWPSSC